LACDAGNIVINPGLAHGLDLLAKLAARPGGVAVVEDPTHPVVPATFAARGLITSSLAVDQDGARTDCLPDHAALAVVTPSHQFPLAGTMSLARRHALLEWAIRNNTLVVELDIAAELHSHEAFMPCLSSLRPDAPVAHLGTFEHLLSEDLPLGYLVVPEQLVGPVEAHVALTRAHPSALVQRAALELFTSGELARYMNRMHRTYQGKRAIVQDHLHAVQAIRLTGLAGNHVAVHLQDETSAEAISAELAQHGVVAPTATGFFHTRRCNSNALILGFGHLSDEELVRGLTLIRRTLATPAPAMARNSTT
jgi:GntR family transcriptional regulator/MocR family aminotransferase